MCFLLREAARFVLQQSSVMSNLRYHVPGSSWWKLSILQKFGLHFKETFSTLVSSSCVIRATWGQIAAAKPFYVLVFCRNWSSPMYFKDLDVLWFEWWQPCLEKLDPDAIFYLHNYDINLYNPFLYEDVHVWTFPQWSQQIAFQWVFIWTISMRHFFVESCLYHVWSDILMIWRDFGVFYGVVW